MKIITYLFIAGLLMIAACTPQGRLNRLIKKHPELTQVDTITVTDLIHIPETKKDTVFLLSQVPDNQPIIIENERIKIRFVKIKDTVFLTGQSKSIDTTIIRKVPVQKVYVEKVKKNQFYLLWALSATGVLLLFILIKR